jgi:uncharacterized membrane protein YhaH (DUF805 family)
MADYFRIGRMYFVLLAVFAIGRFAQGAMGVAYEKAHHVFSIFILTVLASAFYAIFCRRWRGYRLSQAVALGALFGFVAQVVIFLATVVSYALGIDTFFNHMTALNQQAPVGFGRALAIRAPNLLFFPVLNGIAAAIGWALGGMLPDGAELRVGVPAAPSAPTRAVL